MIFLNKRLIKYEAMNTQRDGKKASPAGSAKKELLIAGAEKIFAEKGFHATSIRDIARATNSNVALIYYYFNDKEDLYLNILDDTFRKMSEHIQKSFEKGVDEEERIRLIIKAYISFMGTRTNIPRIMAREMAEGGGHFAIIMQRYISRNYAILQDTIQKRSREGGVQPVDLTLSPLCMIGMMVFFFFASPTIKRILNRQEYDREFLEQLTAQVTHIFFDGIKKHNSEEE